MMVVISTVEEWSSLKSLLKESSGDKCRFSSVGSNQICDVTVEHHSISLHYADLTADVTEEATSQAMEGCFCSCREGIGMFLLLIRGGCYTKQERRMVEILQAHFGAEALKYLVVLSVEDGEVVDTLDDALLGLINACDGRYCRFTSAEGLLALLEMVDFMLAENGVGGYTEEMLRAAKKRSTEDSALNMLKQKVQEAEQKEEAFKLLLQQHEERRSRELKELKAKHAEERKKEAAEAKHYETKRESLQEALISHRAILQLQMSSTEDDEAKKLSVVLLGLSGSGKSSALNLILDRAGNRYSVNRSGHEAAPTTTTCVRKDVFAAGRRLVLVDTPELWDEDGAEDVELVKDCLALALPGPHVFLLVLQVGRFTQGEGDMLGRLQRIFGREFAEHAVVLFVHFEGKTREKIDGYVAGAHAALQELVRKCGSRYYELSVAKSQNALSYPQVKDLLSGINKLAASHGGRSYAVKRFSVQELQERNKAIEERKEGAQEGNFLLRDE
ncbi:GTPase IMAP family member 6-like [Acanthochromis polyacanthus]|uniref:GTPase IMAP family member 6-like n=1 Tax=Acanthochromis polyacanthus TaxID=80966 RepID=UPI002234C7F4|nr:GTPase IMAP family member 6-like [Acanthochromis polyacanthus]